LNSYFKRNTFIYNIWPQQIHSGERPLAFNLHTSHVHPSTTVRCDRTNSSWLEGFPPWGQSPGSQASKLVWGAEGGVVICHAGFVVLYNTSMVKNRASDLINVIFEMPKFLLGSPYLLILLFSFHFLRNANSFVLSCAKATRLMKSVVLHTINTKSEPASDPGIVDTDEDAPPHFCCNLSAHKRHQHTTWDVTSQLISFIFFSLIYLFNLIILWNVHIDMIVSWSCCISMMWISCSSTFQSYSIGLRSGDCRDHLNLVNSLSCSRN